MKKRLLAIMAISFPLAAFALHETDSEIPLTDAAVQDSLEVITIDEIVKEQQETTTRNSTIKHFNEVWGRRSYFNLSFNNSHLMPKGVCETGIGNNIMEDVRSNWGVSLQYGRNYRLHKKPIGNVLQFYVDYTGIDLSFSHYKIDGDGKNVYDSSQQRIVTDDEGTNAYYYIPWNLEKYEGSYGMSIGPSMTIAPFTYTSSEALHFLKFNMYFRVGYQASILYMVNEKSADANQAGKGSSNFKDMSENLKMNWGHGVLTSFGFSLTWKAIGIGYEYRVARNKYKSFAPSDFGDDSYKFKTSTNRIYISFRMGR